MSLKNRFGFLLSPWSIIGGVFFGIFIGVYFKGLVPVLRPVGEIYSSILMMCVIPIMASAVVVSLSKLLRSRGAANYLNKLVLLFIVSMCLTAAAGLLAGMVIKPLIGGDKDIKKTVGAMMIEKDESSGPADDFQLKAVIKEIDSTHSEKTRKSGINLIDFIMNMIPDNIFKALSLGQNLKIVFFFIILGIMMKFIAEKSSANIVLLFEGIFDAFQRLINFAIYFLPIGLCALMADQFNKIGFGIILSLLKIVILVYAASLFILFLSSLAIWKYAGGSYFRQFSALKDAIMIAMGTRTSYAALPSAISGLVDKLKLDRDITNLTVPLGFTLCKYGKILIFCIGAVIAAEFYNYNINISSMIIIIISSVLAGMAASGAPSVVSRSMIGMVLAPIGIPAEAIIIILLAIDPIIDPIITLVNTYPNYAVTAVIANGKGRV